MNDILQKLTEGVTLHIVNGGAFPEAIELEKEDFDTIINGIIAEGVDLDVPNIQSFECEILGRMVDIVRK
jgi:hypothetical protein